MLRAGVVRVAADAFVLGSLLRLPNGYEVMHLEPGWDDAGRPMYEALLFGPRLPLVDSEVASAVLGAYLSDRRLPAIKYSEYIPYVTAVCTVHTDEDGSDEYDWQFTKEDNGAH